MDVFPEADHCCHQSSDRRAGRGPRAPCGLLSLRAGVGLVTGQVKLLSGLDLKQLRVLSVVSGLASPVSCLVYSQDSQNLAVASVDGTVTIFEKSGNKGMHKTPRYLTLQ